MQVSGSFSQMISGAGRTLRAIRMKMKHPTKNIKMYAIADKLNK